MRQFSVTLIILAAMVTTGAAWPPAAEDAVPSPTPSIAPDESAPPLPAPSQEGEEPVEPEREAPLSPATGQEPGAEPHVTEAPAPEDGEERRITVAPELPEDRDVTGVVHVPARGTPTVEDVNAENEPLQYEEFVMPKASVTIVRAGKEASTLGSTIDEGVVGVAAPQALKVVDVATGGAVQSTGRVDLALKSNPPIRSGDRVQVTTLPLGRQSVIPGAVVAVRARAMETGGGVQSWARLDIDVSGVGHAYGGDYGERLTLMEFPACILTTPEVEACGQGTPLEVERDGEHGVLSAIVPLEPAVDDGGFGSRGTPGMASPGTGSIIAAVSGASGATGTYTATDLGTESQWSVSEQYGAFTYSVPLRVPAVTAGFTPEVTVNYNSGAVDGQGLSTNNQPSWVGEGWDLSFGYIERLYKNCGADGYQDKKAELCWESPYSDESQAGYVLSFGGTTQTLLWDGGNRYRTQEDDGWRITRHTGAPNSDNNGEYFKLMTPDGATYYFGYGRINETNESTHSVAFVPVYGDDAGEPRCGSERWDYCNQGYRWMMDIEFDANENAAAYFYEKETNRYARHSTPSLSVNYTSAIRLAAIEYGFVRGHLDDGAEARVEFSNKARCVESAKGDYDHLASPVSCPSYSDHTSSYPDVPMDLRCTGTCSSTQNAPVFFTTQRLNFILGKVRNGTGGWTTVNRHQFQFGFPSTSDGGARALWLDTIQTREYGHSATSTADITDYVYDFDGVRLPNRVDYKTSVRYMDKRRVALVKTPMGSDIRVDYRTSGGRHCPTTGGDSSAFDSWYPSVDGNWDSNTWDCFPQMFSPEGGAPGFAIYHKYLVTSVDVEDRFDLSPTQSYRYSYIGNPAWGYQNDMLFSRGTGNQTWNSWRGYEQVKVTTGSGSDEVTTHSQYYRGMHDDWQVGGTTRSASIEPINGSPTPQVDYRSRQGRLIARRTLDGDGVIRSRERPYYAGTLQVNGPGLHDSVDIRVASEWRWDRIVDANGDYVRYRETEVDYTYDAYGRVTQVLDRGDRSTSADDRCTSTTYVHRVGPNSSGDLVSLAADSGWGRMHYQWQANEVKSFDGACGTGTLAGRVRYYYDGSTSLTGQQPADGNITREVVFSSATTSSDSRATYDGRGRITSARTPEQVSTGQGQSTWSYAIDASRYSIVTFTDALGDTEVAKIEPNYGNPVSITGKDGRVAHFAYDAMGRITESWAPEHYGQAARPGSSVKSTASFTYDTSASSLERRSSPARVKTSNLKDMDSNGDHLRTYAIFDGQGRERETFEEARDGSGGRSVVSTWYDDAGNVAGTSEPFFNTGSAAIGSPMVNPAPSSLTSYTEWTYDWAGRPLTERIRSLGSTKLATGYEYRGDRSLVTAPSGAVTTTFTDARGRITSTVQGPEPGAPGSIGSLTTTYDYETASSGFEVVTVTDPEDHDTVFTSDWVGQRVQLDDPNAATSTYVYDKNGNTTSVASETGVIAMTYDDLDRMVRREATPPGGSSPTNVAEWIYDEDTDRNTPRVPGLLWRTIVSKSPHLGSWTSYETRVDDVDSQLRPETTTVKIPQESTLGDMTGVEYTTTVDYDESGRQVSMDVPAIAGLPAEAVTTGYDQFGLEETLMAGSDPIVSSVSRLFDGRLSERAHGSGVTRQIQWEEWRRSPSSVLASSAGSVASDLQDDEFFWDTAGRVSAIRDNRSSGSTTQHFAYDAYNRLAEAYTWDAGATTWDSNAQSYSSSWTYSASGRVVAATHETPVSASGALSYSYSASHPHAATSVGTDTFTYDDAGRMTNRNVDGESSTLKWDPLSNLLEVNYAEYMYDAAGQRYARTGRSTAESATVWVGDVELTDPDRYYPASMEGVRYYTFGSATVAYRDDAGITTMLGDVQGSAQVAVAPDGAVSRNAYTPYGVTRGGDELDTDRGWLGQVEDGGTGLTYLNARYYDPAIGRFLSPDPLMEPGDPRTLDPYRYADNNPISYSDASGLNPGCSSLGYNERRACYHQYGAQQSIGTGMSLTDVPSMTSGHSAQMAEKFAIANWNMDQAAYHSDRNHDTGIDVGGRWIAPDLNWRHDTTRYGDGDRLVESLKQTQFMRHGVLGPLRACMSSGELAAESGCDFSYSHLYDASFGNKVRRAHDDGLAAVLGLEGEHYNHALAGLGSFEINARLVSRTATSATVNFDATNTTSMASLLGVVGRSMGIPDDAVNSSWSALGGWTSAGDPESQQLQFTMTYPASALG